MHFIIDFRFRSTIDRNTPFEHAFDHLYWQAAGKDYNSGKKSQMLSDFEKKYKEKFITFMKVYNTRNLWSIYKNLSKKNQKNKKLFKKNKKEIKSLE